MSNNKMLIDATHPEETRVVVLRGGRVEEFDFESAARKLLRGNIYLAKVTRVEPSLQAAFVDYGGNRHGFLAFNEIHPDYYQIPVADRQALIEAEAAAEAEEEAAVDAHAEALALQDDDPAEGDDPSEVEFEDTESEDGGEEDPALVADGAETDIASPDDDAGNDDTSSGSQTIAEATLPSDEVIRAAVETNSDDQSAPSSDLDTEAEPKTSEGEGTSEAARSSEDEGAEAPQNGESDGTAVDAEQVDQVGNDEDALEELAARPRRRARSYKIQEVIKRRQVILVQVVKEERGNKGAALTTYLSLAGRYTVLMPNTARGGGISRKITNPQDRKRLKAIAADLEVPEGMGLIIRTAGAARTKQEIRRDFEYLLRLWESVRDLTLESQAPSLVYEEGNLIKRSIRDLYNKEVDEVLVAGPEAHRDAKDFMRMLMPSHAKNVVLYQEPEPLFTRFQIERQLNAMFSPYVTLRSGGYLVINQTEALVAIDVNSGKATHEFSIEETALNTNLEAADEIARQLKLRDLAGLIVIDFIDMEEKRNNRAVERRLKEALRHDRARIQVGRVSHFGLLEMSRQRLRTGVLEGSTSPCPHCQGTGIIRSTESIALAVLRGLEDAIMGGARTPLVAMTTPAVALYILNNKRPFINDMEGRHGFPISVLGTDKLAGANFTIEKGAAPSQQQRRSDRGAVNMDWGFEGEGAGEAGAEETVQARGASEGGDGTRRRRRRRRGSRRGERSDTEATETTQHSARAGNGSVEDSTAAGETTQNGEAFDIEASEGQGEEGEKRTGQRSRRRGRRGGRRGRERQARARSDEAVPGMGDQPDIDGEANASADAATRADVSDAPTADGDAVALPEPSGSDRPELETSTSQQTETAHAEPTPPAAEAIAKEDGDGEAKKPKRARRSATSSKPRLERIVVGQDETNDDAPSEAAPEEKATAPVRKGWWQRRLGSG